MSEPSDPENIALEFVQLWAENMTKVMAQIASAPFPVEIASRTGDEVPAAAEADTYLTVTAAGTVRGEMCLRVPESVALALSKFFTGDADAPPTACEATRLKSLPERSHSSSRDSPS